MRSALGAVAVPLHGGGGRSDTFSGRACLTLCPFSRERIPIYTFYTKVQTQTQSGGLKHQTPAVYGPKLRGQ